MTSHESPEDPKRIAHAPYNFVPLPDRVFNVAQDERFEAAIDGKPRKVWHCHDRWVEGILSGWIQLEIETETPLYVRCGVKPEDAEPAEPRDNQHRQDFFHHGTPDEPYIPGSTLRGMTRSLVEIMSFARFDSASNVDSDRNMFYRGVGDRSSLGEDYRKLFLDRLGGNLRFEYPSKRVRGGYLERGKKGWEIRPAKEWKDESFVHVDYSDATPLINGWGRQGVHSVWVEPVSRKDDPCHGPKNNITLHMAVTPEISNSVGPGLKKGALVESGHMGETAYDPAVPGRMPKRGEKHMHCVIYERDDTAKPVPIPTRLWNLYELDRSMKRDDDRNTRELTEGDPLFYICRKNGQLEFFGPTMMFRLPHDGTPTDRIPDRGTTDGTIDLASALFGTLKPRAIKGRVFFESARWIREKDEKHPFLDDGDKGLRTPDILGAPKQTAFQMYVEQPEPDDPKNLKHWSTPDARVRGWKRYWHQKSIGDHLHEELVRDTQHTIIRPVGAHTRFSGRVRFENLTPLELGALLTALDLPPTKRHQMGMGKPYGMGSAHIRPTLHIIRRHPVTDKSAKESTSHWRYGKFFDDDGVACLGEASETEARSIFEEARNTFVVAMNAFAKVSSFWEIPHIRELGAMLEWHEAPVGFTDYMNLDAVVPGTGNKKWWRERPVLPLPSDVGTTPRQQTPRGPQRGSGRSGGRRDAEPGSHDGDRSRQSSTRGGAKDARIRDPLAVASKIPCVLLEERTKKGGPRFSHLESGKKGYLGPKSAAIPAGLEPGSQIELFVLASGNELQLEYRPPEKEAES
jgi:CRISPR-associated protein (TIGR03986 family)